MLFFSNAFESTFPKILSDSLNLQAEKFAINRLNCAIFISHMNEGTILKNYPIIDFPRKFVYCLGGLLLSQMLYI